MCKTFVRVLVVVILMPIYVMLSGMNSDGLVLYKNPKSGRYGYKSGEEVIIKDKFIEAYNFHYGRAVVGVEKKGHKLYGIIGSGGEYIVKPVYESFADLEDSDAEPQFTRDGLILYSMGNRVGVIGANGKVVLENKYKDISYRTCGRIAYLVCCDSEDKYGMFEIAEGHNAIERIQFSYNQVDVLYDQKNNVSYFKAECQNKTEKCYDVFQGDTFSCVMRCLSFGWVATNLYIAKSLQGKYFVFRGYDRIISGEKYVHVVRYDYSPQAYEYLEVTHDNGKISLSRIDKGSLTSVISEQDNCIAIDGGYGNDLIVSYKNGRSRVFNPKRSSGYTYSKIRKQYSWKNSLGGCYFLYDDNGKISILCSDGDGKFWSSWGDGRSVSEANRLISNKGELADTCYKRLLNVDKAAIKANPKLIPKLTRSYTTDLNFSYAKIEIEKKDKIYTCSEIYSSEDISFFAFNSSDDKQAASDTYAYSHTYRLGNGAVFMNSIIIGGKTAYMEDVFRNTFSEKGAKYFVPESYCYTSKQHDKLMLFYHIEYLDKPTVIYTEPAYVTIAGQVVEVNSGVHYLPTGHVQEYVSLIDVQTMKAEKTIALRNFSNVQAQVIDGSGYICCYSTDPRGNVLLSSTSPLYILTPDLSIDLQLTCPNRYVIYDIIERDGLLYMCGSNTEGRYVGYDNPLLIVYDLKNHKTLKCIEDPNKLQKGAFYKRIRGFVGDVIQLEVSGEWVPSGYDLIYLDEFLK